MLFNFKKGDLMSYVERVLGADESIMAKAKVKSQGLSARIFSILILLIFIIGNANNYFIGKQVVFYGLILIAFIGFRIFALVTETELVLTNKRLIAKFGFFRRSTIELELDKIDSFGVYQGKIGVSY